MRMHWAISQPCPLTLLFFCSVVKPPFSCQISMDSADHWLTPTKVFSGQTRTCRVGIWTLLAYLTTDFSNQKTSHDIVGSQWWSMVQWWIPESPYSKLVSGVFNIPSSVMPRGTRREECVSEVLEIVSNVGSDGK